ncbi:DUF3347 domain-containing protein [Chitinophaga nivalis]|uniref:DUF3347 domain-containing protein n=1 Tax=Chitinophaga nivalis TaxID=2991709 RepID=A0ABT3ILL7_9BACT|nr:DUF3347 domain-containing protein [Chitinophaga nivalis]MCW3465445.1 DUF3347 domain-containing protein [Chitinophaga nivalis]MCW3484863.1 DUF3347 domain-containing protein [Chitinophaga nivalis]
MSFKVCVPVGTFLLAATLLACQQNTSKQEGQEQTVAGEALQAPYNPVFYDSLQTAMQSYYQLSAALVKADTAAANVAAAGLKLHVDSLPVSLLQMDSTHLGTISSTTGSISAELLAFPAEATLEGKREAFQMVSEMLFDLVRNTGLKGQTIYHQYCPMAFDNKGAYWLSDKPGILNPYFGDEMLECGETKDTLRYK